MYKEIAKSIIINNLTVGGKPEGIRDIYDINAGDEELLLRHIKALKNIFEKAMEEMKGDKNNEGI